MVDPWWIPLEPRPRRPGGDVLPGLGEMIAGSLFGLEAKRGKTRRGKAAVPIAKKTERKNTELLGLVMLSIC